MDDQGVTAYRMWFRDYVPETLVPVLERAGFEIERITGSLTGEPYMDDSDWIAMIARKPASPTLREQGHGANLACAAILGS